MMPEMPRPLTRGPATGNGARAPQAPRCVVFRDGQPAPPPADLRDLSEILAEGHTFVWLDVVDPGPGDLALLQEEFALHPLAVEDAIHAHQRPKIEAYDGYWFVVVQAATRTGTDLTFHEVAIFAGARFVVTVRDAPPYPLDEIERRLRTRPPALRRDGGFLLYTLLDTIVDGYIPLAEAYEERVAALEAALLRGEPTPAAQSDALLDIFAMKRDVQQFRRAVAPLRDMLAPLMRGDLPLFAPEEQAYYRDVYDHAARVLDQLDATRDQVNSALQIHLSVAATRQNEVNKQLTLIATIFLPLSFITGFFGQNFGYLVNHLLTSEGTFWWVGIGSEVVTLGALVVWFKRKGWL